MIINRLAHLIATFFYVGNVPVAPGTVGSFAGLLLWWLLPPVSLAIQLVVLLAIFFLGVWASTFVEHHAGITDPSHIVIDEVVGIGISVLFIQKNLLMYGVAFVVFRFFCS